MEVPEMFPEQVITLQLKKVHILDRLNMSRVLHLKQ